MGREAVVSSVASAQVPRRILKEPSFSEGKPTNDVVPGVEATPRVQKQKPLDFKEPL